MSTDLAVRVKGLGKRYKIYPDSRSRVLEWISRGHFSRHQEKWALRDIDLEVPRGQVLGIVGANGAGKTTLLKILSSVTPPTTGQFEVNGRLGSLLQLGAGFHPGFSGRENIFMNAAFLGLPKAEVKGRFKEIAEFAELGDYLYQPVRTYSSGMTMRLGFAVAMMANPAILALDEILAVGDQRFQRKCMERIRKIREMGTTILFVSHSVYHIRQLCDRAIWIQDGRIIADADPVKVTDDYVSYQLALAAQGKRRGFSERLAQVESGPRLEGLELFRTGESERRMQFRTGDHVDVVIRFRNEWGDGAYDAAILVERNDELEIFEASSRGSGQKFRGGSGTLILRLRLMLMAGHYNVSAFLLEGDGERIVDERRAWVDFTVEHDGMEKGVVLTDCQWRMAEESEWKSRIRP